MYLVPGSQSSICVEKEFTRSVDKIEVFTHNDDVFEIDFNLTGNLCA